MRAGRARRETRREPFLLACVPAGAAVMCWVDSGESLMRAGLTLVLSLVVTAIASAVMIWLTAWHPRALLALAVATHPHVIRDTQHATNLARSWPQITQPRRPRQQPAAGQAFSPDSSVLLGLALTDISCRPRRLISSTPATPARA
jgi:hypothetical protein